MGSKIKGKAKKCEKQVMFKRGIVNHILNGFGNKLMSEIVLKMEYLILNKLPISDNILLACWKYDCQRIWDAIKQNIKEICDNPLRNREWTWYKMYLQDSAIWYEKFEQFDTFGEDELEVKTNEAQKEPSKQNSNKSIVVYDRLVQIVDSRLNAQGEKLSTDFAAVKERDHKSFDEMVNFNEYTVNDKNALENGLRQDNEKLMQFPNTLKFMNNNSFETNMENVQKFNLKDLCNSRIYLASLIFVAQTLNDQFHQSVTYMVKESRKGSYKAGPIKQLERSQAKAESDYALRPFPTSANVIDLLRGSVTYQDCSSLVEGVKSLKEMIDGNKNGRNGCIRRVLRIKNMFIKNRERDSDNWMKQYGDIKFNVLIETSGASMIGEIQFLLKIHLDDKKRKHRLYEIKRNDEFIHDMNNVLQISSNVQQNFFAVLHSKNVHEFAQCLFNNYSFGNRGSSGDTNKNSDDIDICEFDHSGLNAFHYCIKIKNLKMLEILISATKNDPKCKDWLITKTKDDKQEHCLHLAIRQGSMQFVERLLNHAKEYGIDFWSQAGQGCTVLDMAYEKNNEQIRKSIHDVYMPHLPNLEKNLMICLLQNYDHKTVKYNFVGYDDNGLNTFHWCCKLGNVKMLEYVINDTKNDAKYKDWFKTKTRDDLAQNCLHLAAASNCVEVVKILVDYAKEFEIDFSSQVNKKERNTRDIVLETRNWNIFQIISNDNVYWPDLPYMEEDLARCLLYNYNSQTGKFNFMGNDDKGLNIFHYCCKFGNINMLEYLINKNDARCKDWLETPTTDKAKRYCFHFAAGFGSVEIVNRLLDYSDELEKKGLKIDFATQVDGNGNTGLYYGLNKSNNLEIVKILVENFNIFDTNIDEKNRLRTVLGLAAYHSDIKLLEYLLESKILNQNNRIMINEIDCDNCTPLIECAKSIKNYDSENKLNCHNFECFEKLLSIQNIDINIKDKYGWRAYLYCIQFGKLECIRYLMENGDNFGLKLDSIELILRIALENNHFEALKYLIESSKFKNTYNTTLIDKLLLICESLVEKYGNDFKCQNLLWKHKRMFDSKEEQFGE